MPLDLTKPVQTKDGRKARVICTDVKSDYPVLALVADCGDVESTHFFTLTGTSYLGYDLINVPQRIKREFWMNVYEDQLGDDHATKEKADAAAYKTRLACVKVTIDALEGEGL